MSILTLRIIQSAYRIAETICLHIQIYDTEDTDSCGDWYTSDCPSDLVRHPHALRAEARRTPMFPSPPTRGSSTSGGQPYPASGSESKHCCLKGREELLVLGAHAPWTSRSGRGPAKGQAAAVRAPSSTSLPGIASQK